MKIEYNLGINSLPKEIRSKVEKERKEMLKQEKEKWNSPEERKKRIIKELDELDKKR
ncbi:hypothetical protein [Clostridium saudiense]|uniref:hypothetical protein n=1 Tax=Clostridium saudiense TaxID=1414720 RepID=UPI0018AA1280|nr:hypothetical protein [Clostridium saudiense]